MEIQMNSLGLSHASTKLFGRVGGLILWPRDAFWHSCYVCVCLKVEVEMFTIFLPTLTLLLFLVAKICMWLVIWFFDLLSLNYFYHPCQCLYPEICAISKFTPFPQKNISNNSFLDYHFIFLLTYFRTLNVPVLSSLQSSVLGCTPFPVSLSILLCFFVSLSSLDFMIHSYHYYYPGNNVTSLSSLILFRWLKLPN